MSGKNESFFDIPPGINRTSSQYAAGKSWWNGNLVRWASKMLTPIGGWATISTTPSGTEPIRTTHSWRDLLKAPWMALGSANKLWGAKVNNDGTFTYYDITPSGLGYNPGGSAGYGSSLYGKGFYGTSSSGGIVLDSVSQWSLDNFGKLLFSVSSQDGRLCVWDPVTPATIAAPVVGAPVDNTIVIATDEEFLMLLGGKNNPRRVKWASRRTYTDWTATETNSAGGFDLQSNGVIIAACRVPGGILVFTDTDVHILEYVGAPYYYGRRRLSTECDLVSKGAVQPVSFGAVWMGSGGFWMYNGAVNPMPSTVDLDVFLNSSLSQPHLIQSGINSYNQELWWFYPSQASATPDRYVFYSFNASQSPYWAIGAMSRTAWLNPIWQSKPIGINNQTLYQQEVGDTADGVTRGSYAETGALDIEEGDTSFRIDRVYPDVVNHNDVSQPVTNLSLTFKLRQAPDAIERVYGPIGISAVKGYIALRMRARQISMRIAETAPGPWSLGKTRLRVKKAGVR